MRTLNLSIVVCICGLVLVHCKKPNRDYGPPAFTKSDSVTERYLALQDSMIKTWNIMISDDNKKIEAMKHLLHELKVTHPEDLEKLDDYEERLDQLVRLRYTQKTMWNTDVIEEYDFASNSLIIELTAEAESKTEYTYNTTLQKLVDRIFYADQQVNNFRMEYDSIVVYYNRFLERNSKYLTEAEGSIVLDKKPTFQMVSE